MLWTYSVVVYMMLLIGFLFMSSFHPFHMLLSLVLFSFSVSYFVHAMFGGAWFSYIFILLFVGGLMVVFVYVVSLTPNEWLSSSYSYFFFFFFFLSLSMVKEGFRYYLLKFTGFYGMSYYVIILMGVLLFFCLLIIVKVSFDPDNYIKSYF